VSSGRGNERREAALEHPAGFITTPTFSPIGTAMNGAPIGCWLGRLSSYGERIKSSRPNISRNMVSHITETG
jgi:hypothetical protein